MDNRRSNLILEREELLVDSNCYCYVISAGLTDGRTIAMRLKGRRPHPDWPVSFPFECPKGIKKCPTREINDVENYLIHLLTSKEPLLQGNAVPFNTTDSYMERHVYVHEPDPEDEEDFPRTHPAVWVPPQVFLEFNTRYFKPSLKIKQINYYYY